MNTFIINGNQELHKNLASAEAVAVEMLKDKIDGSLVKISTMQNDFYVIRQRGAKHWNHNGYKFTV